MTIRIETKLLTEILEDLGRTATHGEGFATDGVLLWSGRGYLGDEPGETGLLLGVSTTRYSAGYTFTAASGDLPPMLWPITDVDAVLAVMKKVSAGKKDHAVEISRQGDEITVAEDPDLFGDGTSVSFTVGPIAEFPRALFGLFDPETHPVVIEDEKRITASLRTDYAPAYLLPFLRIAVARNAEMRTWRYHQRRPVHIQIGPRYRGFVKPVWERDEQPRDLGPDIEVQVPTLPDAAPDDEDVLLADAAALVITQQQASVPLLQRKLRVGEARAVKILGLLEARNIIAPAVGSSKVRDVLVSVSHRSDVLAQLESEGGDGDA